MNPELHNTINDSTDIPILNLNDIFFDFITNSKTSLINQVFIQRLYD